MRDAHQKQQAGFFFGNTQRTQQLGEEHGKQGVHGANASEGVPPSHATAAQLPRDTMSDCFLPLLDAASSSLVSIIPLLLRIPPLIHFWLCLSRKKPR